MNTSDGGVGIESATSRRALLKKLALAGAVSAVTPMIVSSPAYADSGTVKCRFTYLGVASFIATINRPGSNLARYQIITITNPTGTCPCGGVPTFEYAYWIELTGTSTITGSTGWVTFSSAATGNITIGGANGPFSYRMECAVRVRCQGIGTTPVYVCRYGTSAGSGANSYTVPATPIASPTATQLALAC